MRWLLLFVLLWPGLALAEERILSYDSEVQVNTDGSLDVVEHIRVRAEGDNIRRGIYRDFPTRYRDRHGNRVVVEFEVVDVLRNGRSEPWFTEKHSNGVRVNTGDDSLLPVPAEHVYTLRYRTTRQLGFFDTHDELYWNAIGQGWMFGIETGNVEVRLPEPVPAEDLAAEGYSGPMGERGIGFTASTPAPGVARWELTEPLPPYSGLTTALSFPKGVVVEPSRQQRVAWLLRDNLGLLVALAGLVVLLVFCVVRWRRIGRDPAAGTIIVRYDPPAGYSPAGLRYMLRMGYDTRCFSSDLLASAVDGAVGIHASEKKRGDHWTLEKTGEAQRAATPEQRTLLERLFAGGVRVLELDNKNATTMQAATTAHSSALAKRFKPSMFKLNGSSIGWATLIMIATIVLAFGASGGNGVPLILATVFAMVVVLGVFAYLVKAPTLEGRRLLDEIAGFKRYLEVADRDELARLDAPGTAPTLDAGRFERLLPYAVALGVEDAWTRQFTLAVGASAAAAATASIAWYHGGVMSNPAAFTRAVGSSLNSQISSSSTPPGSSSGSGGGGFSGGGGGGGGGGGR